MSKMLTLLKPLTLITVSIFLIHILIFKIKTLIEFQQNFQYEIWFLYLISFVFSVFSGGESTLIL